MNKIIWKWYIVVVLLKYILYSDNEPNKRDLDYICAYIRNGHFYNAACTTSERVICQINGKRYGSIFCVLSVQVKLLIINI